MTVREQVMELVAELPEPELESALLHLRALKASGSWPSLLAAPPDNEPYPDEELRQDIESLNRLHDSTFLTTEEISREVGL